MLLIAGMFLPIAIKTFNAFIPLNVVVNKIALNVNLTRCQWVKIKKAFRHERPF
jgi:hypothetical protein